MNFSRCVMHRDFFVCPLSGGIFGGIVKVHTKDKEGLPMKQAQKWKICRHLTFGIYGALGIVLVLLATLTEQGQIREWTMRNLLNIYLVMSGWVALIGYQFRQKERSAKEKE